MINGKTINVAINPREYGNLDNVEKVLPVHLTLSNGFLSDAGVWTKRPGFNSGTWDVGFDEAIDLLIPEKNGYAVTAGGRVFDLTATPTELTGSKVGGETRPVWKQHADLIIIADGGVPVKIESGDTAVLGGSPPHFKYLTRVGSYTVGAGQDNETFTNSGTDTPEIWPASDVPGNSQDYTIQQNGSVIKNIATLKEFLFIFTSKHIEVWTNQSRVGVTAVFFRIDSSRIDKDCLASDSVINADDTLFWFSKDRYFYKLVGGQAKRISQSHKKIIDAIPEENLAGIYGFDFEKEHKIRWFEPISGNTFVYDYGPAATAAGSNFYMDFFLWEKGRENRVPINSYMELNGKQYFGDYGQTGIVYEWSTDYLDDNGSQIRVVREFTIPSTDGKKTRFNRIAIRGKRGVATSGVTSPIMLVRWKLDDRSWTAYKEFDLGVEGDNDSWGANINQLGIGQDITFEIVETDAVEYLITNFSITGKPLGA